jgi:anaerobic ribonucleoside-triphosphate reductase activating protein
MSPHTWNRRAGRVAAVSDVAAWMTTTDCEHLTVSGGEPFDQALALSALIDLIRVDRDWVVTCYSGYYYDQLVHDDPVGARVLLGRVDLLIDGPYDADRHAPLRWRGSSNQQLRNLTGRVQIPDDEPQGLETRVERDGRINFVGVPPVADALERIGEALAEAGTPVQIAASRPVLPFPTRPYPVSPQPSSV